MNSAYHRPSPGDFPGLRLVAAILLAGALSAGCAEEAGTPEAEIRALLSSASAAAEDGEVSRIAEFVHPDYRDARGHDRTAVLRMLRFHLLREGKLLVFPEIEKITVHAADTASVIMKARFAEADLARLSLASGIYRVELDLVEADGWRVLSADWTPLNGSMR